ncbi:MAG: DivIVA domain-containing protein [Chitinivibrionales bacterium]|nr:DivIVA domain-containing protein [Chitinivibrionales bacterium]
MIISPLDIRKMAFRKKSFGGYDPDQVSSFLAQVADQTETLLRQKDELATTLKATEDKLESFKKIEATMNQALLTAQKATDEARLNAQKEAELIIKDAQVRANAYEDESRTRVHNLEAELASLKNHRDSFLSRFRAMLKTQLELLQTISGDLKDAGELNEEDATHSSQSSSPGNVDLDPNDSGEIIV